MKRSKIALDLLFIVLIPNLKMLFLLGSDLKRKVIRSGSTRTTEQWPIQKFNWRDLTAAGGKSYQYQIVPMVGTPDNLKPREDLALTSPTISLRPNCGDNILAYFNRGILSTQSLVHNLPQSGTGSPDYKTLLGRIDRPGDPLRKSLAGDMLTALPLLLRELEKMEESVSVRSMS